MSRRLLARGFATGRVWVVAGLGAVILVGLATQALGASDDSVTAPDTGGNVGEYTSLALDDSGNPVVSYRDDISNDLKVLHCDDPLCAGDNESITSPDTGGNVGRFTSLALDSDGHPVVSYHDDTNGTLKVLHCNDANCAGDDESITSPDTGAGGNVGLFTSVALDDSGNPVVSYHDLTNDRLKVLHCNDANCAGNNESITSPDTDIGVGFYTSLALDSDGHPVVSYFDFTFDDLKVLHCNDANCAGNNESITSPDTGGNVGEYTSLALDEDGHPVVSYFDGSNGNLKVLHCNDPLCAGNNESITSPDTNTFVGWDTSLALDNDGHPVVSYWDGVNLDLKLLRCNDADCAGDDESITSPDTGGNVGLFTSLALDNDGHPVVSYYDNTNDNLKVLHCNDPDCGEDTTPPTLTVPDDVTVEATDPDGATVDYEVDATDAVDPDPDVVCNPASGAVFAVGDTEVDCTATDDAGNTTTGSFTVTVVAEGDSFRFEDVPEGHLFDVPIHWIADEGITRGCNPPANDRYCPDDPVTRGQMAAFLVRAFGYVDDGGGGHFTDTIGNTFENDADRLFTADVTRGCNPPANDRYCPDDPVTRGQMAAFIYRALNG